MILIPGSDEVPTYERDIFWEKHKETERVHLNTTIKIFAWTTAEIGRSTPTM